MSQRDPAVGTDPVTDDAESTFLSGIEFLTGRDPNLGSFLLVVGMVTGVFIALFQFTLPPPVSHLLTAGVVFVTVLSAVFGVLLDSLGYFGRSAVVTEPDERRSSARPWVPVGKSPVPLPPLLNFDAELRAYADMYEGRLPPQFEPFIEDYLRLKTSTENRATIVSDLRADLNPVGTLFDDGSEGDRLYETISERLFRYLENRGGDITLGRVTFYDRTGVEADVRTLRNQLGRAELDVANEGEAADVRVVVDLYDRDGSVVASRTCDGGVLSPGASRTVDTDIFVPADAERADTRVGVSDAGRTVAGP